MKEYIVYTDGGYVLSRNVGAGAYIILKADGKTILKQGSFIVKKETSQRAEVKAILAALEELPDHSKVRIFTDNLYATLNLGKIPKRKNKPDMDLLLHYKQLVRLKKILVEFEWVRSHKGHDWNELCDSLCTEALDLALQPPQAELF